jgi:hypothetical protein
MLNYYIHNFFERGEMLVAAVLYVLGGGLEVHVHA